MIYRYVDTSQRCGSISPLLRLRESSHFRVGTRWPDLRVHALVTLQVL